MSIQAAPFTASPMTHQDFGYVPRSPSQLDAVPSQSQDLPGREQGAGPSTIFIRSERYTATYSVSANNSAHSNASSVANGATATEKVAPPAAAAVTASNTILKFMEAQLTRDQADGASQEQLASRLQAGLEGFQKGFAEAAEMLSEMEGMSAAVWAQIEQTRDLVLEGVDALQQKFVGDGATPGADAAGESSRPAAAQPLPEVAASTVYVRQQESTSNSFSFKLTTADGDRVKIDASSLRASLIEAQLQQVDSLRAQYQSREAEQQRFSLKVEGELDADELNAIGDLLGKIEDLSTRFFAGDVQQAFGMAMELGYDSSEISSFALKLKHTSVQRMTEAYNNAGSSNAGNSSAEQPSPGSGSKRWQPLGDFVQQARQAFQTAELFQQPLTLMQSIAENFEQAQGTQLRDSITRILQQ